MPHVDFVMSVGVLCFVSLGQGARSHEKTSDCRTDGHAYRDSAGNCALRGIALRPPLAWCSSGLPRNEQLSSGRVARTGPANSRTMGQTLQRSRLRRTGRRPAARTASKTERGAMVEVGNRSAQASEGIGLRTESVGRQAAFAPPVEPVWRRIGCTPMPADVPADGLSPSQTATSDCRRRSGGAGRI